jgi:hypothetical protein
MLDAANYSAVETRRDGRRIEIRAFRPGDAADLESAAGHMSTQTLYRRFFTVKRHFSEREREFFLNVDFVDHVALMAWAEEAGRRIIVGGGLKAMATSRLVPLSRMMSLHVYCSTARSLVSCAHAGAGSKPNTAISAAAVIATPLCVVLMS